jgi:hypothetical protein
MRASARKELESPSGETDPKVPFTNYLALFQLLVCIVARRINETFRLRPYDIMTYQF